MIRRFAQVDVFASEPISGNPVAVVVDADGISNEPDAAGISDEPDAVGISDQPDAVGISDDQMAAFARWTNLSETTFVLPPTHPSADYRLRIFTPGSELPFAGHPTLGSAHAWLESGGRPAGEFIVQECGVGLVRIRRDGTRLAFAAPSLFRSGPVDEALRDEVRAALGLAPEHVLAAEWVANGPQWMALRLDSAQRVLDVRPDFAALGDHVVGLVGAYPAGGEVAFEVRAFAPGDGVAEDPVTGSLNAGLAVWLRRDGLAPASYVAAQGTVLGRAGRVHVVDDGTDIWVGGQSTTVITGTVTL